jgi:hypothetical protein
MSLEEKLIHNEECRTFEESRMKMKKKMHI